MQPATANRSMLSGNAGGVDLHLPTQNDLVMKTNTYLLWLITKVSHSLLTTLVAHSDPTHLQSLAETTDPKPAYILCRSNEQI